MSMVHDNYNPLKKAAQRQKQYFSCANFKIQQCYLRLFVIHASYSTAATLPDQAGLPLNAFSHLIRSRCSFLRFDLGFFVMALYGLLLLAANRLL